MVRLVQEIGGSPVMLGIGQGAGAQTGMTVLQKAGLTALRRIPIGKIGKNGKVRRSTQV